MEDTVATARMTGTEGEPKGTMAGQFGSFVEGLVLAYLLVDTLVVPSVS